MKLTIEIAAAALLVICIASTAASAAGKAGKSTLSMTFRLAVRRHGGQKRRRPELLLQRGARRVAGRALRGDQAPVRRKVLRQHVRRQAVVGDVSCNARRPGAGRDP